MSDDVSDVMNDVEKENGVGKRNDCESISVKNDCGKNDCENIASNASDDGNENGHSKRNAPSPSYA